MLDWTKLRFFLVTFCVLLSFELFGQQWSWLKNLSSLSESRINSINYSSIDNSVLVFVGFTDTIQFDGINLSSIGDQDALLIKYSENGIVDWYIQFGSTGRESPTNVITDNNGNIYVTGSFVDTLYVEDQQIISLDNHDIFLSKILINGQLDWIKNVGSGSGQDRGLSITIDNQGYIHMVGFYKDELYFSSDTLISNGFTNNFYARFFNDGVFIKAINFPGTNNSTRFNSVAMSIDGGKLISGKFFNTLTFPNSDVFTSKGNGDIFVLKLRSNDNVHWARQAGGTGLDDVKEAKSDGYGNIYVVGNYTNSATADSTESIQSSTLTSEGGLDLIFLKYNTEGRLIWKNSLGGIGAETAFGIDINENLAHFAYYFQDTIIINNDTIGSTGPGDSDVGFGVMNVDGDFISGQSIQGDTEDRGTGIVYDRRGGDYICGYFTSPQLTAGTFVINHVNPGNRNGFVAKWQTPFAIAETDHQDVSCYGNSDGSITVTPYFGSPDYDYNWSHDAGLEDSTATGLPAGFYSVTVTDGNSKVDQLTIEIIQPTEITIDSTVTEITCYNENTGAIDITVDGGTVTTDYDYTWTTSGGSGVNPTAADQTGLTAGIYYVLITDDNACEKRDTFILTEPAPFIYANSDITPIVIPPGGNGAIDLDVTGGTLPLDSIYWTGPDVVDPNVEDLTGLTAGGNYSVIIWDQNFCQGDTTFYVPGDTLLVAYILDLQHVSCKGASDGGITLGISNGDGGYTYSWTKDFVPIVANDSILTGLSPGRYDVTVTETSSGKTSAINQMNINEPDILEVDIYPTDPLCGGAATGYINLVVDGGTLPYNYDWIKDGSPFSSEEDLVDLGSGNYRVTVTDANGCDSSRQADIVSPALLTISIDEDQEIFCFGGLTGELTANPGGGTGPGTYSYLWNDNIGQTTKTADFLSAGSYRVTVTDANECGIVGMYDLDEPSEIVVTENIHTDVSCYLDSDGVLSVSASGGTPPILPTAYIWSNGNVGQTNTDLLADIYTLTVTDGNGCPKIKSYTILSPSELVFDSIRSNNITCAGYMDGFLKIYASGGTGTINYSIDGGDNFADSGIFPDLDAGLYPITIQDENECENTAGPIVLTQPDSMTLQEPLVGDISCNGLTDGYITLGASGGAGGIDYSINGGASYQDLGSFTDLPPGVYYPMFIDNDDCTKELDSITLIDTDPISVLTTEIDNISCNGEEDGQITITGEGGTGVLNYTLNPDAQQENSTGVFSNLPEGTYTVSISDENDCGPLVSEALEITEPDSLLITMIKIMRLVSEDDDSIAIVLTGGTAPFAYVLNPDNLTSDNGIFTFTEIQEGSYTIEVSDANLCTTDSMFQVLGTDQPVLVYDAFSPNGDGWNEKWKIQVLVDQGECEVIVYSSWGTKVYTGNCQEEWDGTKNGKDLPAGTYYYIIQFEEGEEISGTVNIVR